MTVIRLSSALWVATHLRQLDQQAVSYYVVQRGADESGTVILKQNALGNGCRVLTQIRDEVGEVAWLAAFHGKWVDEAEADAYIHRARTRDPDCWVIEIEDAQKRNPFEGKII
jgi:hypothetical protein